MTATANNLSRGTRCLLFAVRLYQSFLSALLPSSCKFYPSCSQYAAEALHLHGARRGGVLALRRIGRCHPFTRGGVDLVPDVPFRAAHESNALNSRAVSSGEEASACCAGLNNSTHVVSPPQATSLHETSPRNAASSRAISPPAVFSAFNAGTNERAARAAHPNVNEISVSQL